MISVCLPAFNGGAYINAQLHSILGATKVDEVVVSDDGSTDDTIEVVRSIRDSRVRVINGPRRGVVRNVEHVLRHSRGDRIFLADQDDVWLPGRVERMNAELDDADLAVSDCRVVDAELNTIYPSFFAQRGVRRGLLHNLWKNGYLGCCMAFRRSLLEAALPFPERIPMHDWWIGMLADCTGDIAFIDEPLLLYRRHGGNATPTLERPRATLWKQLAWRANLALALAQRCPTARRWRATP